MKSISLRAFPSGWIIIGTSLGLVQRTRMFLSAVGKVVVEGVVVVVVGVVVPGAVS